MAGASVQEQVVEISVPTAIDLRSSQFRFVNSNADGRAVLPTNGGMAIGVNNGNPNGAELAALTPPQYAVTPVQISGVAKVVASAAINPAVRVSATANGRYQAATAGQVVLGITRKATAAANEVGEVLLVTPYVLPA